MLWKRVFRQEKGNTIFIPFSPTTLEHFLYFEKKAIKLFSLCSETQWLTGTNGMGNPTLGPGVQKNTTWQGSHILYGCTLLQHLGEWHPPGLWNPSSGSHCSAWEKMGRMFQRPPQGPTLSLTACEPAAELLLSVNRGKNIPRMPRTNKMTSTVFSWFIPLVHIPLSLSFLNLYLK